MIETPTLILGTHIIKSNSMGKASKDIRLLVVRTWEETTKLDDLILQTLFILLQFVTTASAQALKILVPTCLLAQVASVIVLCHFDQV